MLGLVVGDCDGAVVGLVLGDCVGDVVGDVVTPSQMCPLALQSGTHTYPVTHPQCQTCPVPE